MDVLVADDDPDIRFMVSAMLGLRGWEVTTAVSGDDALRILDTRRFDVIVLDQQMRPGSGSEVAQACRESGDQTPIVLFTAYVSRLDRDRLEAQRITVVDKTELGRLAALLDGVLAGPAT